MKLKLKKLTKDAVVPKFAHSQDAGMDLYSVEKYKVRPGQIVQVKTGISAEFPDGYVGLFWDKSGMAINNGLKVMGGVMDACYRGEYIVALINLSKKTYTIEKGDKVAQLLVQKIEKPLIEEVKELSKTDRGYGRCGSTGRK